MAQIGPATPFFIVSDVGRSVTFYGEGLGFDCRFQSEGDELFFALVGRGDAQIMLKDVGVDPKPNPGRHEDAPWDAFILAEDPDALAEEISGRGIAFHREIADRDDGLRGFEVADPDGYVCFFGRPATD